MRADVSNGLEALPGGVATAQSLVSAIWDVLDLPVSSLDRLHLEGSDALQSAFPVTELAAATIGAAITPAADADYAPGEEATSWGPAKRLLASVMSDGALRWDRGASQLGSAAPSFT